MIASLITPRPISPEFAATSVPPPVDRPLQAPQVIVEGLCTSLMLIAAAPPLVTGWPVAKMLVTG